MYLLEIISTLITPITLLYIFFFILVLGTKYLRLYARNKTLRFTQETVKSKQNQIFEYIKNLEWCSATIENLMLKRARLETQSENIADDIQTLERNKVKDIETVFSLYNELAFGINEGLYDESYVRIVLGYDMIDFYKRYYGNLISNSFLDKTNSRFLPLELLLKKWDSDERPFYHLNTKKRD